MNQLELVGFAVLVLVALRLMYKSGFVDDGPGVVGFFVAMFLRAMEGIRWP